MLCCRASAERVTAAHGESSFYPSGEKPSGYPIRRGSGSSPLGLNIVS